MKTKATNDKQVQLHLGNNIESLKKYADNSIHAVIIDGPYGLNAKDYDMKSLAENYLKGQSYLLGGKGIAGMKWDSDLPSLELAYELLRVLKPGGHIVCFAGSRTYDILAFTLRFAGLRIKDQLIWAYASGVPKGQWLDRTATNESDATALRGLNSSLKPAIEPIVLAQKPIAAGETIASNVLKHGTGALNIGAIQVIKQDQELRYPANIITDGSKIVNAGFHGGTENFNSCPPDFFETLLNPIFYYSKPSFTDRDFGLDNFETELRRKALFSGNELDI
jgi:site-specific DNA-methyltransferase (adenine-specific)